MPWTQSSGKLALHSPRALKAALADFRATLAELRVTMTADKTHPLELPPLPRRELN